MSTILCGDIGGTHANLCLTSGNGVANVKHLSTASYKNFCSLINDYIKDFPNKPKKACFAVAGALKNQRVEMTNAKLVIDANELKANTPFNQVVLINDFTAVGWGINCLQSSDCLTLNRGSGDPEGTIGCLGAGTGFGKCFLTYDKDKKMHVPKASEGGHADFAAHTDFEWELVKAQDHIPSYETFLSGRGIERLYAYLQKRKYPNEKPDLSGKEVSQSKKTNPCSNEALEIFTLFFARAAKNFALDLFATGGIYLAGGIAAKNQEIFGKAFLQEFYSHPLPHYQKLLKEIPVMLITNYDISLKGVAFAAGELLKGS